MAAARALLAYRRGERGEQAMVGALLEAEHFDNTRVVSEFCVSLARALGRK